MDDLQAEYAYFFREEFPGVVRTVALVLNDVHRAEETAQEAFIQLLAHWKKVSRYERPDAWVRRVAVRLAVRTLRRDRLRALLEAEAEPPAPRAPLDVDVVRAVAKLPAAQRAAVVLFYFEDRPVSEVAEILNCSQSTAKVHLHRARNRLGRLLGEEAPSCPLIVASGRAWTGPPDRSTPIPRDDSGRPWSGRGRGFRPGGSRWHR